MICSLDSSNAPSDAAMAAEVPGTSLHWADAMMDPPNVASSAVASIVISVPGAAALGVRATLLTTGASASVTERTISSPRNGGSHAANRSTGMSAQR